MSLVTNTKQDVTAEQERAKRAKQQTRRWIKVCLLLLGGLMQLVRILNVQSATGETPFLSANDRSRWCTILALTAQGNYVIDDIIEIRDDSPPHRRTWYTIDMVQHRGADGQQHYYSSKPPLLPTLYAGVYWVVRSATGATLTSQPFLVVRIVLVIVNLLPLVFLWWLLLHWADRYTTAPDDGFDWRFVVLAVFAVFGTFLTTFVVTINNHLPAAISAAISLWALEKILQASSLGTQHCAATSDPAGIAAAPQASSHSSKPRSTNWFIVAGLATSFTAANELPALCWVVLVAGVLALLDWRRTALAYLPALLPVTLAFFVTNYWAHGTWRPAYSQRAVGAKIASLEIALPADLTQLDPKPIANQLQAHGLQLSDQGVIRKGRREGVWELWDAASQWRIALRVDGLNQLGIYHWGDWYDYPNSYWVDGRKKGVDRGEASAWKYAVHCLVGYYGIFSLTPFWLIALLGAYQVAKRPRESAQKSSLLRIWLGQPDRLILLAIATTSLVVIGFYLMRPLEDRNYGGVCCGLRWAFWLIPLWYWLAIRGLAVLKTPMAQVVVVALLAVSLFSATYPWSNPWTHPWYYQIAVEQ